MAHFELLVEWLRDAHAMENALEKVLENHVKDAEGHPQMQAKMQEHLQVTRRHAQLIHGCLERHGADTSTIKTGLGNVIGWMQGISTGAAEDELVKNALADYAAEHFEIACYRALIIAAEEVGDSETARICREILSEEESMASWLELNLPVAVREIVHRKAMEHSTR
jgi:ferritin-like metal-binding protein YciE